MSHYPLSDFIKFAGILTLLILFSATASSEEVWTRFTSGNHVNDIAIDGDTIWCATNDCLVRWDTKDMSHEFLFNDDVYSYCTITAVAVDLDGVLWVGGEKHHGWEGGQFIMSYNGEEWKSHLTDVYIMSSNDFCIAVDHNNVKWIGTSHNGVFRYDGETWTNYTTDNSFLNTDRINAITVDHNNKVWFGCSRGLTSFDGEVWSTYLESSQGSSLIVDTMAVDHDNVKWVSTSSNLFVTFDESDWGHVPERLGKYFGTGFVKSIVVDNNNVKWIACPTGLVSFADADSGEVRKYTIDNGLANHDIICMAVDDDNRLWLGYPHVGLACFNGETFETFTLREGPLGGGVGAIAVDGNNVKWVGTSHVSRGISVSNGVSSYDGMEWKHFPFNGSMLQGNGKIMVDENNVKWISRSFSRSFEELGSQGNNIISAYNDTTWSYFRADDEYAFNKISPRFVDRNGVAWHVDRYDGVRSFDGVTWTEYPELAEDGILTATLAPDNAVWFGGKRITCYDGISWTFFEIGDVGYDLPLCNPSQLAVDYRGVLWYGTGGCSIGRIGFGYYTDGQWYVFKDFGQRTVNDIAVDFDNVKWFSSVILFTLDDGRVVSVGDRPEVSPEKIILYGNTPNPFNISTIIEYSIPAPSAVRLTVFSLSGQKMTMLVDDIFPSGRHSAVFDGSNLASGLYFYRLEVNGIERTGKMLLVK